MCWLFDGLFQKDYVQFFSMCTTHLNLGSLGGLWQGALHTLNYSTKHTPQDRQGIGDAHLPILGVYSCNLVKNLKRLGQSVDIGTGGCLSLGFEGLAHDFYLLDITGANTWFPCSLMNPMLSSQTLDPENQANNCMTHKGKSATRAIKILGNMSGPHYPVKHHNGTVSYGPDLLPPGRKEAWTLFGCESKTLLISVSSR